VTDRPRFWLAAAVGLWMAHPLLAGEPARLGITPDQLQSSLSPDQQVADSIADRLRQSGQLRHYRVDVTYQNGVAELTGRVTDAGQRDAVLRLVKAVPGVERVSDRLELSGPGAFTQAQAPVPPPDAGPKPNPALNGNGGPLPPMPIYQGPPTPNDLNPPRMPPYAWPTYAPYNNYSRVAYPTLYPYQSWPYIGPCYPFPKVPLGWRSVKLEWNDGKWWYSKTASGHDWWRLRYW
jgi:hypothetical protein